MTIQPIRIVQAVAATTLLFTGTALPSSSFGVHAAADPIHVVASTSVYGDIVGTIGGDRVVVTSIIDSPNADPEAYENTPADAEAVFSAGLVIMNGGGYDEFITQLLESAGGERTVLNVTEFSGLEDTLPEGEEFNEHLWFNLPLMQDLADQIAVDLTELSPDDETLFTANATSFNEEIDGLIAQVEGIKAEHEGARVVATEPLPLYLLADAGIENVAPDEFMEASEEGTDAPAAVVDETLQLFETDPPVEVLLLNTQTQTAATDRVLEAAEAAGVPVVEVNETLQEGSEGFVAWMGAQIDALEAALAAAG